MEYLSFRHARQHFAVPIESVRFIAAEADAKTLVSQLDQLPYELIGELVQKITVDEWISLYEKRDDLGSSC